MTRFAKSTQRRTGAFQRTGFVCATAGSVANAAHRNQIRNQMMTSGSGLDRLGAHAPGCAYVLDLDLRPEGVASTA